jgi:hypothetical protein
MEGFLGFALMFAMVCWIWHEPHWFFRHRGAQDARTAFLNSVLGWSGRQSARARERNGGT